MSGFSPKTRRLILERDRGICQFCGELVSVEFYSLQHRRARGMGGSKDPVANSPANGVTVHGSGVSGCHGYIESHPKEALQRGFRVPQGQDPRLVPLVDWRGVSLWLLPSGGRVEHEPEVPF